jgi:hypothetical protein
MRLRLLLVLTCALAPLLGGLILSKYYWGYWISPPTIAPELTQLEEMHFFVELEPRGSAPDLAWTVQPVSIAEIEDGATDHARSPVDAFRMRLHAAVHARFSTRALSSLRVPDPGLLTAIEEKVGASPVLVKGDSGYNRALELRGHAAGGPVRSGETLVALALDGWDVSNDHRPLYDFVFACSSSGADCRTIRQQQYFEDVAGIEGARWPILSVFSAVVLAVLSVPVAFGYGIYEGVAHRRSR